MTDLALHRAARTSRTTVQARPASTNTRNRRPVPAPAARTSPEQTADHPASPALEDAAAERWNLVVRAKAGDKEAFGLIYDQNIRMVFKYVYFRVGNRQLTEDLTSDVFEKALKNIHKVEWQGRDIGAWLITIAKHLILDHYKSGRYRYESVVAGHDISDANIDTAETRPGRGGDTAAAAMDLLDDVDLYKAIRQLTPEQQEAVILRYVQGVSVSDTAQIMDKDPGAIKALTYRAVRSILRFLPEGFTHHSN